MTLREYVEKLIAELEDMALELDGKYEHIIRRRVVELRKEFEPILRDEKRDIQP